MNYDPALKAAMKEIEEVCAKHDCAAFVSLHSKTHGEFRFCFPKWSMVRIIDKEDGKQGWHLKAHMKTRPEETTATVAFIYQLQDIAGNLFMTLDKVKGMITQHMKVEHSPFPGFAPHLVGPGEVVSLRGKNEEDHKES